MCRPASKKGQGPAGACVGSGLLEAVGAGVSQVWCLPAGGKSWVSAHQQSGLYGAASTDEGGLGGTGGSLSADIRCLQALGWGQLLAPMREGGKELPNLAAAGASVSWEVRLFVSSGDASRPAVRSGPGSCQIIASAMGLSVCVVKCVPFRVKSVSPQLFGSLLKLSALGAYLSRPGCLGWGA